MKNRLGVIPNGFVLLLYIKYFFRVQQSVQLNDSTCRIFDYEQSVEYDIQRHRIQRNKDYEETKIGQIKGQRQFFDKK